MDDLGDLRTKTINPKLFWARGAFLVAGPSGLGKTSAVVKALEDPAKYMDLLPGETTLWVFTGASHELETTLRGKLDFSIFNPVHFLTEPIGECQALKKALRDNESRLSHCIFVDDYITYSKRDTDFIKELIMKYKRHEKLCLIVAVHQLTLDVTGTTSILINQIDRLVLPKSPRNLNNLDALVAKRRMTKETHRALMRVLNEGNDGRKERGLAVYDFEQSLFIQDYHALQTGDRKTMAYGESRSLRARLPNLISFLLQRSGAERCRPSSTTWCRRRSSGWPTTAATRWRGERGRIGRACSLTSSRRTTLGRWSAF